MYQPVQDRVVIQPLQAFQSAGGIIFSDNSVPKSVEGMVVAVGPGKANKKGFMVPMEVAVGEKVLFERGQGDEVTIDGKTMLVVKQEHIMGIIE